VPKVWGLADGVHIVIVNMLCQFFVPAAMEGLPLSVQRITVSRYDSKAQATAFHGDRLEFLRQIPDGAARLVVTSPPYNIGKKYEKRLAFEHYLEQQEDTIKEAHRALADDGSLCWQVGNHVSADGEIFPIDVFIYQICKKLGMKLRNRIIWCFEHGLHCRNCLSGRYENIARIGTRSWGVLI